MAIQQMLFTDLPRGKGYNPSSSGYQIKALSDDLTADQREWLSAACMHYGDAVYRSAPRGAMDKEMGWRASAENLNAVPAEILNEFPIAVSYIRLDDDHFSLTRVRYLGVTHDGRMGNFLARSLLLEPKELITARSNPLAVVRSGILDNEPAVDGCSLPAMQNLPVSSLGRGDLAILKCEPFVKQLPALLSALCAASEKSRPLLICLDDWRKAPPLLEALLTLLPPSARRTTSFCTYESDRAWLPSIRGQRPAGWIAAHQVMVLGGADERAFGLRPDEYQGRYAIFNFVSGQFTQVLPQRAYAEFTADCVVKDNLRGIEQLHELIEELGIGHTPDAWDDIIPVAQMGVLPQPEEMAKAGHAVVSSAVKLGREDFALSWLIKQLEQCCAADDSASLSVLQPEIDTLMKRMSGSSAVTGMSARIMELAVQMIQKGKLRTASVLLQMTGAERDQHKLEVLHKVLVEKSLVLPDLSSVEKERWLDLLQEGLAASKTTQVPSLPQDVLLHTIFQAAAAVNRTGAVWATLGKSVVMPYLTGEWDHSKQALARYLFDAIPVGESPEGTIGLGMLLLKQGKSLSGGDFLMLARKVAAELSGSASGEAIAAELVEQVKRQSIDPEQQALLLGGLAETALETKGPVKLVSEYQEAAKGLKDKQVHVHRRKLAEAGAGQVLLKTMFEELLPWDGEKSPPRLQQWRDAVFNQHPAILEQARGTVAELLLKPENRKALTSLAVELLPNDPGKGASQSVMALWSSVIGLLPLVPDGQHTQNLPKPPDSLPGAAAGRLRIMQWLKQIAISAEKPGWSLVNFPVTHEVWRKDVRMLDRGDKHAVWNWCLQTFQETGISTPAHIEGMRCALDAIGERDWLPDSVARLLKDRDVVTCVLAVVAFIDQGIASGATTEWGNRLKPILERMDRQTVLLLKNHLEHRFMPESKGYREQLTQVCECAGLSLSVVAKPPSVPVQPIQTVTAPPKQSAEAAPVGVATHNLNEMISKGKQAIIKTLFGQPEKQPIQPQPTAKKDEEKKPKKRKR